MIIRRQSSCRTTTDDMSKFSSIKLIGHLLATSWLLAAVACSKDPLFVDAPPSAVVHISVDAESASLATKADPETESFRDEYGIFACVHEDSPNLFAPFKPATYNAYAEWRGSKWQYMTVVAYKTGELIGEYSDDFVLVGRDDNATADLYAYAPWTKEAYLAPYGPTRIPFTRGQDLKYAIQNTTNGNAEKDPASTTALSANFTFRRMMVKLNFCFRLLYDNTAMEIKLTSIKRSASAADGKSVLYTGGTYNAVAGTFNAADMQTTGELSNVAKGNASMTAGNVTFSILLVPTDVGADDDLTFTFTADDRLLPPFELKRSQIRHGSSDVYGFQPGYEYTFKFSLDNYVRFDGFSVDAWTSETLPVIGLI